MFNFLIERTSAPAVAPSSELPATNKYPEIRNKLAGKFNIPEPFYHVWIPRIVYKNNSIPGDNSWQYINYEFMVLENEVIVSKNFCYNDKGGFSDLIIELSPENSSVSKN